MIVQAWESYGRHLGRFDETTRVTRKIDILGAVKGIDPKLLQTRR